MSITVCETACLDVIAAWPDPNRRAAMNGRAFERCSIVLPFSMPGKRHPENPGFETKATLMSGH